MPTSTTCLEHAYQAVRLWAEDHSIRVRDDSLPAATAGEFDGVSVTMNRAYETEERAWYLIHALGSMVLWSRDRRGAQQLFDNLRAAGKEREADLVRLDREIARYRKFETDASCLAVWLLGELRFPEAVGPYTNFMRADLEALTEFHRHGKAPVWRTFFRRWNEKIALGRRILAPFPPEAIPPFQPVKIERQEILQEQGA